MNALSGARRSSDLLKFSMSVCTAWWSRNAIGPSTFGMTMCRPPSFSTNSLLMMPGKAPTSVATNVARLAKAVEGPGVALDQLIGESGLAHLAVADDVDAGLDLFGDDFGDRLLHARRELDGVDRLFVELVPHHADEVVRTRQAPGGRRQDALGAALHLTSSSLGDAFLGIVCTA